MTKRNIILIQMAAASLLALASCATSGRSHQPSSPSKEAARWYASGTWKQGFTVDGYEGLDVETFHRQYTLNRAMYDSIFAWLHEIEPVAATLPAAKGVMTWSHATATVQDLELRPIEKCQYEQHRRHIDLQWTVTGSERYAVVRDTTILDAKNKYNEAKDVQNFVVRIGAEDRQLITDSDPHHFFLLFPGDIHRPCEIAKEPGVVRKIVVKIDYTE